MSIQDASGNLHSTEDGRYQEKTGTRPAGTLTREDSLQQRENIRECDRLIAGVVSHLAGLRAGWSPADLEDAKARIWVQLAGQKGDQLAAISTATDGGLVRVIAKTQMGRLGPGDREMSWQDRAGWGKFTALVRERENREGRMVTDAEAEVLAQQARASFPPGQRPTAGFHRKQSAVSIDAQVYGSDSGTGVTLADRIVWDAKAGANSLGEGAAADWVAEYDSEESDRRDRDNARRRGHEVGQAESRMNMREQTRHAWNLVAEGQDAPLAVSGSISRRAATAARAVIEAEPGGVLAVADAWRTAESTEQQDKALFAPFGNLSAKQQQKVTDVLLTHPGYAQHLWRSAMTCSSSKDQE